MTQRSYVGDRLIALRKQAELSLSACARLAGVDKGNLWRIEHGTMRLPAGYVEALAAVLGSEVYRLAVVGKVASGDWRRARLCPELRQIGGLFLCAAGRKAAGEAVVVDVDGVYVVAEET